MADGGGGGRGHPEYGGRAATVRGRGGGRALTAFVWPLPGAAILRPSPLVPYEPATGPHRRADRVGYHTPAPVTIRAPTPTPSPALEPFRLPRVSAPFQLARGSAPFQPARVSAPLPAPPYPTPCTASIAKELEQKLFVSETALAPPAAAAAAAAAASQADQPPAEKAPEVDLTPVSKKVLAHPAHPGAATAGRKVMIRANHFLVNVADNNLFHYDVSINPESKSRQTNREVLSELIKVHGKTSLGGKLPAYDGRKSLYTAGSLPFESEELSVTLVDPEKKDKERAEREYKITIRIAGRTDLYHLQQFLCGRQRDMPQETIQVLDVVLRESPSWNYITVSRSFFSTTFGHRGDIGEGLECWRCYYQSLRPTQMGLSLNIDISATSFFKPVTVIQFVQEFLNLRDVSRPLTDRDRVKIKKALRGVCVETNHQKDQIRRYKITGLTPIPMSQLIFPVDERGTRMTVVQYFMQRYDYRLEHTNWPCLQSGSDARPVYLPMEACKIVEGQRYSKKLNDKQVTNILRATCQRPQQREQSIREMVLHNKYAEDKFAQEFGIKVCSDLVSVPARVLPPPMKMINGGTIDNWACLSFSRMRPEEVYRFCCDLTQMCNATGMSVNPRPVVDIRTATPNNIEDALRDVHSRTEEILSKQGKGNLQVLIVILPEFSGFSYGKIKRICKTELMIASQCCLPWHASRSTKEYLEDVALKINVKAGGHNTVTEKLSVRNGIPFVSEVPTIISGADVTHPPPGEDSASSIAAVTSRPTNDEKHFTSDSHHTPTNNYSSDGPSMFQAMVNVLSFPRFPLLIEAEGTVQELLSKSFLKIGIVFDARVMVNNNQVPLNKRISEVVYGNFSFYIIPRVRGGAHTYLRKRPLLEHIASIGPCLFDVVTMPIDLQDHGLQPYFIGLSTESINIVLLLINLIHEQYHLKIKCPNRFDVHSLRYNTLKKKMSFVPELGSRDFSVEYYFHNWSDLGSVIAYLFKYNEVRLFQNSENIHVHGENPLPAWRLPVLLDLLVHDLEQGLRTFSDHPNVLENKRYLETHVGVLTGPARHAYLLASQSDASYMHGEHHLEIILGLRVAAQAQQPLQGQNPAGQGQNPAAQAQQPLQGQNPAGQGQNPAAQGQNQAAQAQQPLQGQNPAAVPNWEGETLQSLLFSLLKYYRGYDFERVGPKYRYDRNWVEHAPDYVGRGMITSKQAESFVHLVLQGLLYNVRLRTRFPTAPVNWATSPRPLPPHAGGDTTQITQPWCRNEYSPDEFLSIS